MSQMKPQKIVKKTKKGLIPKFVKILYKMLEDSESAMEWNENGTYFFIRDMHQFLSHSLKKYFKKQLNTYGFKKLTKTEKIHQHSFQNDFFQRENSRLFYNIKRRYVNKNHPQKSTIDVSKLEYEIRKKRKIDKKKEELALLKTALEKYEAELKVAKQQREKCLQQNSQLKKVVSQMHSNKNQIISNHFSYYLMNNYNNMGCFATFLQNAELKNNSWDLQLKNSNQILKSSQNHMFQMYHFHHQSNPSQISPFFMAQNEQWRKFD